MKAKFNKEEYDKSKSTEPLKCECYECGSDFEVLKKEITRYYKKPRSPLKFCSYKCDRQNRVRAVKTKCQNCNEIVMKPLNQFKKNKNNFCSHSCAATYNNTHKTTGTRRSKLETWLEQQLSVLYPELNILFNQKEAINSELDIHIPSLNLAFELNGIFHYEPIYGSDKLSQIQNNDQRKFQACLEQSIELCIIDTSSFKNFKEHSAKKYLNIITDIINRKIVAV